MRSKAARRYLRQVKLHLFCNRAHRKTLLNRAQTMIEKFSEERPDAEYADLTAAFGPPQNFAENILEGVEQAEIDNAKQRKKFLCRGAVIFVILALTAIAAVWYYKYQLSKNVNDHAIIINMPAKVVTEEELEAFLKESDQGMP